MEVFNNVILNAVKKHIILTDIEEKLFCSLLEYKTYDKKSYFLNGGEICKYSMFVLLGCFRGYTIDSKGIEHILSFAPKGWWIADMYSLLSQLPGEMMIEALENSEVFLLSKINQEKLYNEIPKFERFFRILIENSLIANQKRLLNNLSLTAEERYLTFCKTYPTLIHQLPQKQIASYIGVTQEFFSRMKTNLLKKQ